MMPSSELNKVQSERQLLVAAGPTVHAERRAGAAKPARQTAAKRAAPAAAATETAKSLATAEENVAKATSKLKAAAEKHDVAQKKKAALDTAAEATEAAATNATLLRETRARVLWLGSFGLSLIVALGTICAMLWIWITALDDHLRPAGVRRRFEFWQWAPHGVGTAEWHLAFGN